MKRLLIVPFILLLASCATEAPLPPKIEQIPVPVPFCPAPPDYADKLPKEGGLDYITPKTPPVMRLLPKDMAMIRARGVFGF